MVLICIDRQMQSTEKESRYKYAYMHWIRYANFEIPAFSTQTLTELLKIDWTDSILIMTFSLYTAALSSAILVNVNRFGCCRRAQRQRTVNNIIHRYTIFGVHQWCTSGVFTNWKFSILARRVAFIKLNLKYS